MTLALSSIEGARIGVSVTNDGLALSKKCSSCAQHSPSFHLLEIRHVRRDNLVSLLLEFLLGLWCGRGEEQSTLSPRLCWMSWMSEVYDGDSLFFWDEAEVVVFRKRETWVGRSVGSPHVVACEGLFAGEGRCCRF